MAMASLCDDSVILNLLDYDMLQNSRNLGYIEVAWYQAHCPVEVLSGITWNGDCGRQSTKEAQPEIQSSHGSHQAHWC